MKNDLLKRLIESREQLGRLKAVNCRMAHERVLLDRDTRLPVAGAVPEMEFQRVGLCDAAKRYRNPACSHTMARYPMADALDILESLGEYDQWRDEFNQLNNAIHLLDHAKGDAEKQLARGIKKLHESAFKETEGDSSAIKLFSINEQINEMELRHNNYAAKIEKLRNKILAAVNSAIEIERK